jgi:hypothetical protein
MQSPPSPQREREDIDDVVRLPCRAMGGRRCGTRLHRGGFRRRSRAAPVRRAGGRASSRQRPRSPLDRAPSAFAKVEPPPDPTGGAYTTPTLLFIPAAAVPVWNARVIASITTEGPTAADRLASGTALGFQPGLGAEIGLPAGFTVGAGTVWVGGDTSPMPVSGGLSPYAQARYQILGDRDGHGFLLGTSATYKFVGFDGDPGEIEEAVSGQYRRSHYEVGLQGVLAKTLPRPTRTRRSTRTLSTG